MTLDEILNKISELEKTDKINKIAEALGMTQQNLSGSRKRDSIPYKHIIAYCIKNKISIDPIFGNQLEPTHSEDIQLIRDGYDALKKVNQLEEEKRKLVEENKQFKEAIKNLIADNHKLSIDLRKASEVNKAAKQG